MAEEKAKFERKRDERKSESLSVEEKAKVILDSKMPEEQKNEYLKKIGWIVEPSNDGKVTFATWSKVRKIEKSRQSALMVYPKAKNVRLATLVEWDEIFKNF